MIRPGPRNLITDIPGIAVGHAVDERAWTGATVVLPERPMVAGVDVRGGAPGLRETALLDPVCTVEAVDALVLSGGSAFGLAAADGVMEALAADGRGFSLRGARVPIVPAAILFDLANGGDKGWSRAPYRDLGQRAYEGAGAVFPLGNVGAGFGARSGILKGGLGSASSVDAVGRMVGALVAVNSVGSTTIPGTKAFWAWPFEHEGEFGGRAPGPIARPLGNDLPAYYALSHHTQDGRHPELDESAEARGNTTLAVIATNTRLTKTQATRLAIMAQDGLARAIRPIHTPLDGDVVFALSAGERALTGHADLAILGGMAADCLARAVARAVYAAEGLGRYPAYRDWVNMGEPS